MSLRKEGFPHIHPRESHRNGSSFDCQLKELIYTSMLESLTIFAKGGLVLYQYVANPSLLGASDAEQFTQQSLNELISTVILDPASSNKTFHIKERVTFCWLDNPDKYVIAIYPDIMFEGPREYLKTWVQGLLQSTLHEYSLLEKSVVYTLRPDPALFDPTFQVLLKQSKGEKATGTTAMTAAHSSIESTAKDSDARKKSGKEKRTWHDGKGKVTAEAMAELDMSKQTAGDPKDGESRALAEARAAYLPTDADLEEESVEEKVDEKSWASSVTGLMQSWTGNKTLSDADLDQPLKSMEQLLTSKNVAREVAHELCLGIRGKLEGKKLNSLYRVQTAVRQALESTLTKMLKMHVDLLRNTMSKRGDNSLFKMSKRAPYVIAVVGINGVGKSTSLAKLAYYFKQNGCSPLLVAGDTFRSGAVEQLKVHASCLDIPMYSQGYSKDPSIVAKAAIQHATEENHDVVLIDTAGRMQNNVPLMKALGKLVTENKPDFVILVCEALVGHDGLSQFTMFKQALGIRGIDGLILTKFDTVSDKVGAALTLTHQTGAPIIFCGTGQKYHHLKKLSVTSVIQSLFAS